MTDSVADPEESSSDVERPGVVAADEAPPHRNDRDVLRWACREQVPCGIVLPGRGRWGRSFFVGLREGGPRPVLAVAQPTSLIPGRLRPLRAGRTVRVWSVADDRAFHLTGRVENVRVLESASKPVTAALIALPWRLLTDARRLSSPVRRGGRRIHVAARRLGDLASAPRTLLETWVTPEGDAISRGAARVVELTRRSVTFSLPRSAGPLLLPGTALLLSVEVGEGGLRTEVSGRVAAVMACGDHMLHGVDLGGSATEIDPAEHREVFRLAAASLR
jgi:hypothetical protein